MPNTEQVLHVAGRFDEKIRIIRPDTKGRFEILKVRKMTLCQSSIMQSEQNQIVCAGCCGLPIKKST